MIDKEKFHAEISKGDRDKVKKLIQEALAAGESAEVILDQGIIPAMGSVGQRFKDGEIYIPEVLLAARAMHAGMELLKPILTRSKGGMKGKVLMGTVKGDLHDIGKNLVGMMLEGGGYEVVDLGTDVSASKFLEAIEKHKPQVVGMSALLTTTMLEMKNTIQAIEKAGLRKRVKTIVGGAPVTEGFAKTIGADGFALNAREAVDVVTSLVKAK